MSGTIKFTFSILLIISLFSCKTKDSTKGVKGKWVNSEKVDFMKNCIASAEKSYAQRGQQGDSTIITTMCLCAGEIIEQRYSPEASIDMPAEEGKAIMIEAAKKCLTK